MKRGDVADSLKMTRHRLSGFWIYLSGQAISAFGSAFTAFLLPLLVYELTGSATGLALTFASGMLPYPLFGLVAGAWADRADRKRLMISADVIRALFIAMMAVLYSIDALPMWWLYITAFLITTFSIVFDAAAFAALPSIVASEQLVAANGHLSATFQVASLAGPLLAGLLAGHDLIAAVLWFDACTFVMSALSLLCIRQSFNQSRHGESPSIRSAVGEGLRYIWGQPVLRSISAMMVLVNFATATTVVQLILFASVRLGASGARYGVLVAGSSLGIIVCSLIAPWLRQQFSFSAIILGGQICYGLSLVAFALSRNFLLGLLIWAIASGLQILVNINLASLRQIIVPDHLLGRASSAARVLAWSATPVGALLGSKLSESAGVAITYLVAGVLATIIPIPFLFSPLGRHVDHFVRDTTQSSSSDHS